MKNIMIVVMAIAMVVAFAPKADAGESAQLGLQVTFAVDQDLERVAQLKANLGYIDAHIAEAVRLFDVDGDGKITDKDIEILQRDGDFNRDGVVNSSDIEFLKQTIQDLSDTEGLKLKPIIAELDKILNNRPDLESVIQPVMAEARKIYELIEYDAHMLLKLQPVISIELEGPNPWTLQNIPLGGSVYNSSDGTRYGVPIHALRNTGNVPVDVVMKYASFTGLEPSYDSITDHFQTSVALETGHLITIQPPDSPYPPAVIRHNLVPGNESPMLIHYTGPAELTKPVNSMSAEYDISAYKSIVSSTN